ncbi:MAG: hypothetical protein PHD11_06155 [Bacteroidales bacterium]|nr:hypothetical protein [Bacteroidales bacterium]MDD4671250.1 hypothetical protein [Bacteroidales bacterium]
MNTKHKSFLLPHHFQIVGWILFTIVLLWGVFVMATWQDIDLNKFFIVDKWFLFVMYTFLFLAAGLVGLSREKQEDEYISNIRASSLAITAYITIIWFVVYSIFDSMVSQFGKGIDVFQSTEQWALFRLHYNPQVLYSFLLYIIIFKSRLIINRWRVRHEK